MDPELVPAPAFVVYCSCDQPMKRLRRPVGDLHQAAHVYACGACRIYEPTIWYPIGSSA
jgi:predicted SprT family Zn-dependent metalloprotease